MNSNIEELITLNFELEGLLYLALHRGNDTPNQVWAMIAEKIDALHKSIDVPSIEVLSQPVPEPDPLSDHRLVAAEMAVEAKPQTHPIPSSADAKVRLDEKLAREHSRDLRRAFSLNDKFRFRRELFKNSDDAFAQAITQVEQMTSVDEARQYFYESLGFDRAQPFVADFMAIIEHHIELR